MPPLEDFVRIYDLNSLFTNQQRPVENRELDHLVPHKFSLTLDSYINPGVAFNVQSVAIPDVSVNAAEIAFPILGPAKFAGDLLTFGALDLSFIVDEKLLNYREIMQWIVGLAMLTDDRSKIVKTRDITLFSHNQTNHPTARFEFKDAFPISLSSIPYDLNVSDSEYFLANVTFEYQYFVIRNVESS